MSKSTLTFRAIKIGMLLWGIISLFQGAALSFFVNGRDQYQQTGFIELTFCSMVFLAVLGFWNEMFAAVASSVVAGTAGAMLFLYPFFQTHTTNRAELLKSVLTRPLLSALVFGTITIFKLRQKPRSNDYAKGAHSRFPD